MQNGKRTFLAAGMMALSLAIAGCSTTGSTPYQPVSTSNRAAGGFSDERLATGDYRVTFSGNRLTSRETVESYLLYRSAELTVEQGYDWFVIVDREVEHRVDPFWASRAQTRTIERFEATAEIRMGRGAMPAENVRAFDARDVIARIGPQVQRPED